jgi:hypothetical protein
LLLVAALVSGCGSPNKANVQLRKEKQQLEATIADLKQQHEAALARIATVEKQTGTLETLPSDRLKQLFTVHKIELGRLTGGADVDLKSPGDEALKVYLTPLDEFGQPLNATGQVTVELFDLSRERDNRIGRWELEPQEMKESWRSLLRLNAFVLTMPWQTTPERPDLAVKVTFRDLLTGRTFEALKDVQVKLPSSSAQAATQPRRTIGRIEN